MSEFRKLVETILKNNGYDLKEWDDDDRDEYYGDPDDHTVFGDEMTWTLDLPMNDQLHKIIIDANIVGKEDLKDDAGNWLPTGEFDVIVEYDIEGYPDDEYVTVNKIYLEDYDTIKHQTFKGADITNLLPEGYLEKVANELEDSGKIDLHSYDYEGQVRDDYYSMIAPGGKL